MFFQLLASFVQSIGAIQQGNATAAAASYNKRISLYNASVTEQQGKIAEDQLRKDATRRIGAMRANIGASGLSSEGSAMDLLQESAFNAEMDALNTRYNYQTKAKGFRMEGELQGMQGKAAKKAGYLSASGILLAGAGKAYEQYSDDNSTGKQPFRLGS